MFFFVFLEVFGLCQFLTDLDSEFYVLYEQINEYLKELENQNPTQYYSWWNASTKKERETDDQTKSEFRYFYEDGIWCMLLYQRRYWKLQCSIRISRYLIEGIQHLKASSSLGTSSLCTYTHTNTLIIKMIFRRKESSFINLKVEKIERFPCWIHSLCKMGFDLELITFFLHLNSRHSSLHFFIGLNRTKLDLMYIIKLALTAQHVLINNNKCWLKQFSI